MQASVYPESPTPVYPATMEPVWDVVTAVLDSGAEQRRLKNLFPKYNFALKYNHLTTAQMQTLYAHHMAARGTAAWFWIYDPDCVHLGTTWPHTGQYVGVGDGATQVFDLPGRSTASVTIYIDGTEKVATSDYSLLTGGGDASADRVNFTVPPADGEVVTCDFTGILRARVRYAQTMTRELFQLAAYTTGIRLTGLKVSTP